jgi:hypothetical protein
VRRCAGRIDLRDRLQQEGLAMATNTQATSLLAYDRDGRLVRRSHHQVLLAALADIAVPRQRTVPPRGSPSALAWTRTGAALRRAMAMVREQG